MAEYPAASLTSLIFYGLFYICSCLVLSEASYNRTNTARLLFHTHRISHWSGNMHIYRKVLKLPGTDFAILFV